MRVPFLEIPFFKAFATAAAFPVVALPIYIQIIHKKHNKREEKEWKARHC
jgi:hypothetical protein